MGLKILYGILIALGIFIVITLIRAIFFVPKKRETKPLEKENVDVDRAAKHLSGAIQIPTISYSDKNRVDWSQFEKFHKFLEESYPLLHKTLEREDIAEASLLYRWKGKNPDLEPIALLSHQDVVPIEPGTEGDWTHEPFSGYNDGEFIWGRGALDMKNHLICVMEAVETLLEEGYEPERDVYLCFGHDEEVVASNDSGAKAIMETLKSRGIHLDSVIDEGGAILPINVKHVLKANLAGIGIAEKGYADFSMSVRSKGGHSSQPPKHSAIGKIANVVRDVENHQFKSKLEPFVLKLFSNLGRRTTYPVRVVACNLWLLKPLAKFIMEQIPPSASLIRTTTGVTMAEGSPAANVLPQEASVTATYILLGKPCELYTIKFYNTIAQAFKDTTNNAIFTTMYLYAHLTLVAVVYIFYCICVYFAVIKFYTVCYLLKIVSCYGLIQIDMVDFFLQELRMGQLACEVTVIG